MIGMKSFDLYQHFIDLLALKVARISIFFFSNQLLLGKEKLTNSWFAL